MNQLNLFETDNPQGHHGALFSPCRKYRYCLWRVWNPLPRDLRRMVAFIGLNPSTADETTDDPTIRRCKGFAQRWGYDGMIMINAFAYRATDPDDMKDQKDPVGPLNNVAIVETCRFDSQLIVACWGTHCTHCGRESQLMKLLAEFNIQCFGKTKDGHPKHPLYLPRDFILEDWPGERGTQ